MRICVTKTSLSGTTKFVGVYARSVQAYRVREVRLYFT